MSVGWRVPLLRVCTNNVGTAPGFGSGVISFIGTGAVGIPLGLYVVRVGLSSSSTSHHPLGPPPRFAEWTRVACQRRATTDWYRLGVQLAVHNMSPVAGGD